MDRLLGKKNIEHAGEEKSGRTTRTAPHLEPE